MKNIPFYDEWVEIEHIDKGWSHEKKYYIKSSNGKKFLLRIAKLDWYDKKKKEFETMKEAYKLGVTMSQPIDFGVCEEGTHVYSLLTWIDGTAADEIIQTFSEDKQYKLGIEAGKILKKFHSIPAPLGQQDWEQRMINKFDRHLKRYEACGIKVGNEDFAKKYIQDNLDLLKNRPQTYQHGDFHVGNLVVTPDNKFGVIDFNRWDYGDPFEEFYKAMIFNRELSIPFTKGQINGYFESKIPNNFFDLVALYLADVILYSVAWAIPFGAADINKMIKRAEMILSDYDNFSITVPKWFSMEY